MHELSIAQALIEKIIALAREQGAESVSEVHVEVGALSGVNPEALEMAFPVAAEETAAKDAKLVIQKVSAAGKCASCGNQYDFEPLAPVCSRCGSAELEIKEGRQLLLKRVELVRRNE